MLTILHDLFSVTGFISNVIIAISYFIISLIVLFFIRPRSMARFRDKVFLFSCIFFILSCGLSHAVEVAMMWWPVYWWHLFIRAAVAFFSLATVIQLVPILRSYMLTSSTQAFKLSETTKQAKNEVDALAENLRKEVERFDTTRKKHDLDVIRNNEILQRVNEILFRSNEDLKSFAYAASHDLQEPLRAIGGFTQMIVLKFKDTADEETIQYMRFVTDGVARMGSMIRDLLEYTRIESKGQPFEEVSLSSILKNAVIDVEQAVIDSGATVQFDDVLPILKGDAKQLQRVFQNLILNAITFAKPGVKPVITIKVEEHGQWFWVVSIKDNGVGIEERFRDRIFQLFKQLDHDHDELGGTGVGLTVCRKIITRHAGRIWVDSEVGTGSIFSFTLPRMDLFDEMQVLRLRREVPVQI